MAKRVIKQGRTSGPRWKLAQLIGLGALALALAPGTEAAGAGTFARTRPLAAHQLRHIGDEAVTAIPCFASALADDPLVWLQQKVVASNGATNYYFGSAVAISGNGATMLIGSAGADEGQGVAYIFTRTSRGWKQTATLIPGDGEANEAFGSALALSADGKTALIGAWNKTVNDHAEQGAAYVFTTSDNWATHREAAELTASDGGFQNDFGNGVALSADGMTVLVGAPSGGYGNGGSAYVFTSANARVTYTQTAELTENHGAMGNGFGIGVAISADGATALVGDPGTTVDGNPGQGAVFLFILNDGSWSQKAELTANDGEAEDVFGNRMSLSADGTTALVSAIGKNNLQGAAYVFTTSDGWRTNTQVAELTASDGTQEDQFAWAVALSADGNTALVGSIGASVGANVGQGKAYVYGYDGGAWTQTADLTESDGVAYDGFAAAVAISGNGAKMLMGSGCHPYDQTTDACGPGAAYVFGTSNLSAALSVPGTVQASGTFENKYIVTNASATVSVPVTVQLPVPGTNASYVSYDASQGSCSYDDSGRLVTCALGSIVGNGGTAWAALKLKATGTSGTEINQTAKIANGKPKLEKTGSTTIQESNGGGGGGSGGDGSGSGEGSNSGGGVFGFALLALFASIAAIARRRQLLQSRHPLEHASSA